ncbi:MAG TPA: hypothetical protein VJ044_14605, partial [Candidatus Hodarchaeales archaeon]|nr:hypothetical protein [Candidatus Hodarchaeales archaeon]
TSQGLIRFPNSITSKTLVLVVTLAVLPRCNAKRIVLLQHNKSLKRQMSVYGGTANNTRNTDARVI